MQSVLLVGLGNVGLNYDLNREVSQSTVTHAGAISNILKPSTFFAIDLNDVSRKRFSEKYGSQSFERLNDLPSDINPDLIIIATPIEGRVQLLHDLLKFRNATYLMEKPLASSFNELDEIVGITNKIAPDVFVNFQRRSSPVIKELRERIQSQLHSSPIEVIATFSGDSKSNSAHMFDLFSYLFSDEKFKMNKSSNRFLPDLIGHCVNIRLNHLNSSSRTVFELQVFTEGFVAKYDSTFDSVTYSYSMKSELYKDEMIYNSWKPIIKKDIETGIELVYRNLLKRESKQEYDLCSFVDAITTSKLYLDYWDERL
jgi:predicted dehydrogenase